MKKKSVYFFMGFLCFSCSHAQFEAETLKLPKNTSILVAPFDNLTSYPNAGEIVAEILTTELDHQKLFRIVDTPRLKIKNKTAHETGKITHSDYVLTGTITEFRYTKGIAENPSVALQFKLLKTKNSNIIWRASASDVSQESAFSRSASLNELTQKLCQKVIAHLEVNP